MTLRVKLELVPFGDEGQVREIGRLDIFNTGSHSANGQMHEYRVIDLTAGKEGLLDVTISHTRAKGAWALVSRVLNKLNAG